MLVGWTGVAIQVGHEPPLYSNNSKCSYSHLLDTTAEAICPAHVGSPNYIEGATEIECAPRKHTTQPHIWTNVRALRLTLATKGGSIERVKQTARHSVLKRTRPILRRDNQHVGRTQMDYGHWICGGVPPFITWGTNALQKESVVEYEWFIYCTRCS